MINQRSLHKTLFRRKHGSGNQRLKVTVAKGLLGELSSLPVTSLAKKIFLGLGFQSRLNKDSLNFRIHGHFKYPVWKDHQTGVTDYVEE